MDISFGDSKYFLQSDEYRARGIGAQKFAELLGF